jgi:phosphoenolpyruvate synthase/pyruvate phosphate dikinase
VWSSLFDLRAFDERYSYNVDDSQVGMGVLIHQSYPSEGANGVAISRDALDPDRGDLYYLNAQVGEALVTNPAPGVTSDEIVYDPGRTPHVVYHGQSSLAGGKPILTDDEVAKIACSLSSIHSHFRPLIDPQEKNTWFAMDIEFKLIGSSRQLIIKQARPYSFGIEPPAGWCDF